MKLKIKINFGRLNDPGLAAKGKVITSSLTNNHFYPDQFPDYVSSLALINETIAKFEQAYLAGLSGDKQKIAARKAIRKELIEQLTGLARYCELVSKGNLEMLTSTGFDIRKETSSVTVKTANTRIPVVTVKLGHKRGMAIAMTKPEPQAFSYHVQLNAGNPALEADWYHGDIFAHGTSMVMENLLSGKDLAIRIRYVLANGYGPWSNPVFFMPT